jgi:hypothetical protein
MGFPLNEAVSASLQLTGMAEPRMLRELKGERAMTIKLELRPEVETGLLAAAQAQGLSLETYLERVIHDHAMNSPAVAAKEWDQEFDAWVSSFPEAPLLSDEAISRESMYPDRW